MASPRSLTTIPDGAGPAWRRVYGAIQERISGGAYGPGTRLPTERALGSEFGANRSAVRVALDGLAQAGLIVRPPGRRPSVVPVNGRAGSGARRQTALQAVAVVMPQHEADLASREIVRAVSQTLRTHEARYRLLIFDTDMGAAPDGALEREACTAIAEEGIAGAVVWPTMSEGSLEHWRRVRDQGHPIVFVDRHDSALPCDYVGVDNYAAAREAVEYLLHLGHTRIAHLTCPEPVSTHAERAAGYRDALRDAGAGGDPRSPWFVPEHPKAARGAPTSPRAATGARGTYEEFETFVDYCVESEAAPTAVFALNDRIAHTLIACLEARGVRVPDQISVIGFDDEDRYSPRPALLTTMRQPFERIGQRAAEMLLERLSAVPRDVRPAQHVLLPTYLIERSTCKALEKPAPVRG